LQASGSPRNEFIMQTFAYKARDTAGQSVSGTIIASSDVDALRLIRSEGKYPISVRLADPARDLPMPARRGMKL